MFFWRVVNTVLVVIGAVTVYTAVTRALNEKKKEDPR